MDVVIESDSEPAALARAAKAVNAVVVAVLVGMAAAFSSASPTGRPLVDALLLALSVAAITHAVAWAPSWVAVVAAGVALVVAADVVLVALAAVALALGVSIGLRKRNVPEWRAISVGISMNVLARADLAGFFGLSVMLAIAVGAFVFVMGIRGRPKRIRRIAWAGVGAIGVLAVLATAAFGFAANEARADLRRGEEQAEEAISMLDNGQFALAADRFEAASASLRRAEERLRNPWAAAASLVPVVSQHRTLAVDLSGVGSETTARLASAMRMVDPTALRLRGGAIDLAAFAVLEQPLADVDDALEDLAAALEAADSPWLLSKVGDELDALGERITETRPRLANARDAVALAPRMLGADGPRTYLVLLTTPAEARGLGGFPGNYAELTMDQGRPEMTNFGRLNNLQLRAREVGARITGPEEFLVRYGSFGFDTDGNGLVGDPAFGNLTITPNFPWVGEVAAELYRQTMGKKIDGVLAMDPFVLQSLLSYTDGVDLASVPYSLTGDNALDFLLRAQYVLVADRPTRIDALEEAAEETFDELLGGDLPDPVALAHNLGPLVEERRLLMWSADEQERDLLRRVGLLGEIPPHNGADGWSFAVSNAGSSKIDSYLERRASYHSSADPSTGETTGTLRVELTNTAPATGLPPYVIGNAIGLPDGSSRLYVSFYSPLLLTAATRNGDVIALAPGRETGWNVYSEFVTIPSGGTVAYELRFAGRPDRREDLVTWTQPLALPLLALD